MMISSAAIWLVRNFWMIDMSKQWFVTHKYPCCFSGLLVSYLTLQELEKRNGKMNWLLFYFHRFWRWAPPPPPPPPPPFILSPFFLSFVDWPHPWCWYSLCTQLTSSTGGQDLNGHRGPPITLFAAATGGETSSTSRTSSHWVKR